MLKSFFLSIIDFFNYNSNSFQLVLYFCKLKRGTYKTAADSSAFGLLLNFTMGISARAALLEEIIFIAHTICTVLCPSILETLMSHQVVKEYEV